MTKISTLIKTSKNGGYPPLKYKIEEIKQLHTEKIREYATPNRNNINVRQLLSETKKSFIFNPDIEEHLEILTEL
jgi:hypothetical protein